MAVSSRPEWRPDDEMIIPSAPGQTAGGQTIRGRPGARRSHAAGRGRSEAGFGPNQLAAALGARRGAIGRARELGLIPEPGPDGRWPADTVEQLLRRWPEITAAMRAALEIGPVRCAARLAALTGLPVVQADVAELTSRGLLTASGSYRNWSLYRLSDVDALAADPRASGELAALVTARTDDSGESLATGTG